MKTLPFSCSTAFTFLFMKREKLAEDAEIDALGEGFKGFTLAYNAKSKEEVDQIFDDFKS
ncbi:MAG: hypothetical protein R3B93_25370 [Bacteroidia bacterium]